MKKIPLIITVIFSTVLLSTFCFSDSIEIRKSFSETITAEIKTKEVFLWDTYSKTSATCNQIGTKYIVKYIEIEWDGEIKDLFLDMNKKIPEETMERSIVCEDEITQFNNFYN